MIKVMEATQTDTEQMTVEDSAPQEFDDRLDQPDCRLDAKIEALLLVAERPMTEQRIVDILELSEESDDSQTTDPTDGDGSGDTGDDERPEATKPLTPVQRVRGSIARLNEGYEQSGRAFRIIAVSGGYQVMTLPEHGEMLSRLRGDRQLSRLTPAALETLAIIAYRQPVLRADLEAIRGVACGEVLRGLLERRLVRIVGRAEELGRPMLYGTTKEFLQVFGLGNLKDLPRSEDL